MFFFSGTTDILACKYGPVASCELSFTCTVRYELKFTFFQNMDPTFLENYHLFGTHVENHFTVSELLFLDTVLSDGSTVVILPVPWS